MSTIFISHATEDTDAARRIKTFLGEDGLGFSVFLDADIRTGVPTGSDWEHHLYRQLRACRALVLLSSRYAMASEWCFAEVAYVRALEKPIFPLKLDEAPLNALLADTQFADLSTGWDEGLERLQHGLSKKGLDPEKIFDWPPPGAWGRHGRPSPYPGLPTFEERHAGVFFGRSREIEEVANKLHDSVSDLRASVVMLVGDSGSGKSSLVRAGLVPHLRNQPDRWLVLDPIRCTPDDPVGELALALERIFDHVGVRKSAAAIAGRLEQAIIPRIGTDRAESDDGGVRQNPLLDLAIELKRRGRNTATSVLLTIDQFEELLQRGELLEHDERTTDEVKVETDRRSTADAFLHLLREALEAPASPLVLLATQRLDFVAAFSRHPELRGLAHESYTLQPLSGAPVRQVITGPAERAGIKVDEELVNRLVQEASDDHSLPLLAFVLRALDDACGQDDELTLHDYSTNFGSLEQAVGETADQVVKDALAGENMRYQAGRAHQSPDVEERLEPLKLAFLRLVRVVRLGEGDEQQRTFTRRQRRWAALPPAAHPLLERLVDERLLVASGDGKGRTLEVAHEALFSSWKLLDRWLRDNPEALELAQQVHREATEWNEVPKKSAADYLLRGSRLERVLELKAANALILEPVEEDFVRASEDAARADLRDAELRARRYRRLAAGLFAAFLLAGAAGWWGWMSQVQKSAAEQEVLDKERRRQEALDLALQEREEKVAAEERVIEERNRALTIQGYLEDVFVPVEPERRVYAHSDLRSMLDDGDRLLERLDPYPEFQASMRDRLATAFVALGEPDRARELYAGAVEGYEKAFAETAADDGERQQVAARLVSALLALTLVLPEDGEPPTDRAAWEPRIEVGRRALEVAEAAYDSDADLVAKARGELAADLMRVQDPRGRPMLMQALCEAMKERCGDASQVEQMFDAVRSAFRFQHDSDVRQGVTRLTPQDDRYVEILNDIIERAAGEPGAVLTWALPTSLEAMAEHFDLREGDTVLAGHLYRCAEWFALKTYKPKRNILTLIIQRGRARFLTRHRRELEAADLLRRMETERGSYLAKLSPFEQAVITDLAWSRDASPDAGAGFGVATGGRR